MKVNGSLELSASGASEIRNLRVQKYATEAEVPSWTAADAGRLVYAVSEGTLWHGTASTWVKLASGGDADAVQSELNALEAALGTFINADGTFDPTPAGHTFTYITAPASVTHALAQLDAAVAGVNSLAELTDVSFVAPVTGDLLRFNGTAWVDATLTEAGVQPLDATLTALASFDADGLMVQTTTNAFTARSLVAPAAGLTITNANGVNGNPTFVLANDLAALEALASTGYVVRTGDGAAVTRAVQGTPGSVVVTNGDGVAGATSIALATVPTGTSGAFQKLAVDAFGRVTDLTAVTSADVTALVDAVYVNAAGDTMSGSLNLGGNRLTGMGAAVAGTDGVNLNQLNAAIAGLDWKASVRVATTTSLDLSAALEAGDTVDGITLETNDRVLVKDQTAADENGIYVVQPTGQAVRALDLDEAVEFGGATVFVEQGTVHAGTGWTQTGEVTTLGDDPITWVQFNGGSTYVDGIGLTLAGNTFNVSLGAGLTELPTDGVGIDLHSPTSGALILTTDGTARSTVEAAKLHLLLDATGALTQGVDGLRVAAGGVTNAMLVNSIVVTDADTGTNGSLALGGTLQIAGSAAQGITTAISGSTFTVAGISATTTQRGVAAFDAAHFSVTDGTVSLAASLDDLLNVSDADGASSGDLLRKSAGDWIGVTPATVAADMQLGDLGNVGAATPTAGYALVGNGASWNSQKVYHLHDQASASTTWTVVHDLGQRYCNVTVVDATDEVVVPHSITFNSTTQLTVTFNTPITGKVVVMSVA